MMSMRTLQFCAFSFNTSQKMLFNFLLQQSLRTGNSTLSVFIDGVCFAFNSYIPYLNSVAHIVKTDRLGLNRFCHFPAVDKVLNLSGFQLPQISRRIGSTLVFL